MYNIYQQDIFLEKNRGHTFCLYPSGKECMKQVFKKLALLMVPLLTIGCSSNGGLISSSKDAGNKSSSLVNSSSEAKSSSQQKPSSSSQKSSSSQHTHSWAQDWSADDNSHWHACSGCNQKNDNAAHTYGEWEVVNLGEHLNDARFNLSTVKVRKCSVCQYEQVDNTQAVLPEVRITYDPNDPNANFATAARSTDVTRPTVTGKVSITNAGDKNMAEAVATVKVRGNQTAGFDKKGLQIKLDKKANLLGLNGGKKFKKWVLLADAKDTTISRTALGLSLAKGVIAEDSKVWATDFTPVSVYLNNQYWGMYMLAEQKEVKDGRIKLDEPIVETTDPETGKKVETPIMTTDIGYNFELDYYAKNEADKGAEGDPTFSINYGSYFDRNSYNIESPLANSSLGLVSTYTMNSDINDSTATGNQHTNDTNSNQVKFMKNRLQALFNVLGEASKNNVAKDINENNQVVSTTLSVRQTIEKNFDLNAWAEGFIINAVCLPPDVGYSSFYLSFDNTPDGDHKLRFDNPWDFDSNFGNRRGFIEKPDTANTSGNSWNQQTFDPYFMDRTANMWFNLLGKFDFFMNDYVKPKWKAAVQNKTFEGMLSMLDVYFKYYEGEYQRNFKKWTTTQASDNNVGSYFNGDGVNSGELRKPFVNVSERKDAQKETINWVTKRVNYLDGRWGK